MTGKKNYLHKAFQDNLTKFTSGRIPGNFKGLRKTLSSNLNQAWDTCLSWRAKSEIFSTGFSQIFWTKIRFDDQITSWGSRKNTPTLKFWVNHPPNRLGEYYILLLEYQFTTLGIWYRIVNIVTAGQFQRTKILSNFRVFQKGSKSMILHSVANGQNEGIFWKGWKLGLFQVDTFHRKYDLFVHSHWVLKTGVVGVNTGLFRTGVDQDYYIFSREFL